GANFTNECWALEFGTPNRWIRIDATGIAPVGRAFATAIYDPQRDRLVMTAGSDPEPIVDLWALDFSGTSAWEALPPVGGGLPTPGLDYGDYDSARDQMVLFGGAWEDHLRLDETWALRWGMKSVPADSIVAFGASTSEMATGTNVTVDVAGAHIPDGASAEILTSSSAIVGSQSEFVRSGGTSLTARFALDGAATGSAALRLVLPGGRRMGVPGNLSIVAAPVRRPWVQIVGPSALRPDVERVVYVVAGNDGNVDAIGVPIVISGIPLCAQVRILKELSPVTSDIPEV